MTREEAIKHLKLMQSGARNAIRFKKNDKEISEEERKEDIEIYQDQLAALNMATNAIEREPKTGHWIEVIDEIDSLGNKTWHHKCSICGNEDSGWGNYKYCPNCGAKMESEDKE